MTEQARIAYLLNLYPAPSGTFIRGEIEGLEALGENVARFSVRRWEDDLVDPSDQAERERTSYLLSGSLPPLIGAFLKEIVVNPVGLARALPGWRALWRSSGDLLRSTAYLMQAARFRQEAKKRGVTHAHAHFSTNPAAVVMLSRLLGGPKYSFTAHGPDEFLNPERNSFNLKIANADFVVAITSYCRDLLIKLGGDPALADKIVIARCGIDVDRFTPAPPVAADNRHFVCVGRLCPQKGQIHIPAAVAALREMFPDLRVTLVGDGESRADIEAEIARLGVGDYVRLHGWGSNAEVRRMVSESRALLLPSYAEGLPIAIMEALAMGRPVISTTITGIPELVDASCGWLVAPGDHDQLVGALRAALDASPDRLAAMGREGRARVERLHDRHRLVGDLRRLFLHETPPASDLAEAPAGA